MFVIMTKCVCTDYVEREKERKKDQVENEMRKKVCCNKCAQNLGSLDINYNKAAAAAAAAATASASVIVASRVHIRQMNEMKVDTTFLVSNLGERNEYWSV